MMASFMSYFGGRKDPKQAARDAIVGLRQQLQLLEKKEEHLQKKIDEEHKKARASAVSNKAVATQALKRKKAAETELDRLGATRLQLELQVNTLESANLNAETMAAMKKGSEALKVIHGNINADKVADMMDQVHDQTQIANEISTAIATNPYADPQEDEDILAELGQLEEDVLNERLAGADHVPVHVPPGATKAPEARQPVAVAEDDEEAQLRELQAQLAL
ncbi:Snf7-domain-containing protein [Macrolepiota fuliginosa MF-IS2]|uniref:Vacuolar-sorting protein SNF7 n=1 Tax=Macrolepiota fuliginosa MF-IS2 TaxID=1400762 RepID=A0A9P5XKF4_9AGAR|nr:Snf7-domain-containing protein [Macrolepiota fuliginosa MF-IS2]